MRCLVVGLGLPRARDRVTSALNLAGLARALELVRAPSWATVRSVLHRNVEAALIADPYLEDAFGGETLRTVRRAHPPLTMVLYLDAKGRPGREIAQLGTLGALDIFTVDLDDQLPRLAQTLGRIPDADRLFGLIETLEAQFPKELVAVIRLVVEARSRPLDPSELIRIFGSSRRSLERALSAHGLPGPEKLILWGRLLSAARLLDDPGRKAEAVSYLVGFPSASAFSMTFKRYVGATVSEARNQGMLDFASRRFLDALGAEGAA